MTSLTALAPNPLVWPVNFLNILLKRQPAACEMLAQHAGRTFHVCAADRTFALNIQPDGTFVPVSIESEPDVTLRIDIQRLIATGWRSGQPWPDEPGLLHVSGDAAMAQTLSSWAKAWRPEPEDLLADWIGDVAAMTVVDNARQFVQTARSMGDNLRDNMVEYLAHEARVLTPDIALQAQTKRQLQLATQLDAVSTAAEQLAQRLTRLEAARAQRSKSAGDSSPQGER